MQDNFNIHSWKLKRAITELEEKTCPDCGCKMEGQMCNECGYMEEGATFTDKHDDNPKLKGDQKDLPDALQAKIVAKEGEDHEVSMAQNSLKSIISSASQLMSKLGDDERNIPGWIQDHITNAENFIDQANQGFHELEPAIKDIDVDVVAEDFDANQTQLVAKEVAKALVLALKEENTELSSLKIKNVEPKSFEIYVTYKDGSDDEFSFDIRGNKIVLSDFTFTEEVGTVDENGNVDKNEVKDNLLKVWAKHIKKLNEAVGNNTLKKVESVLDLVSNLKSNTSTNSNIPTTDKQGLVYAFQEIEDLLEDVAADIEQEDEYVSDYSRRRAQELDEASDNPEGDKLVLRFLQGISKKFEYPVSQAAMFVKERIKKLGY